MNNKNTGAGIGGLIVVVLGIAALVITRIFAMPLFRVLLWVVIGIVALVIIGIILLLVLGNRTSNKAAAEKKAASGRTSLSEEQASILQKGRTDLMEIRRVLVKIKSNTIRSKGNEICGVSDKILQTLKEKPEQITSVRQFLNYYLPTLDKILTKYQKLEAGGVPHEDTAATVEKYLGDVKEAMDKQYTNLFEADRLDMTVDMEAMTIGLKRDGLLSDADFQPKAPQPEADEADQEIPDIETPLLEEPKIKALGLVLPVVPEPEIPDVDEPAKPELKLYAELPEETDESDKA